MADWIGVAATAPIVSFLPILMMAILFGLAMDYEVFLVSRMRESYVPHRQAARLTVSGASQASARVVTAAAIIMIAVFGAS